MTDVEPAWERRDGSYSPGSLPGAGDFPAAPVEGPGGILHVNLNEDSDFWKDQPVGPGCILEVPVSGIVAGGPANAELAFSFQR